MEYRSAIVDELGCLVAWCCELSSSDIDRIFSEHPEYTITGLECARDGYIDYE